MAMEKLSLSIDDEEGLQKVSEILHDAVFRHEWLGVDHKKNGFKLTLWREIPGITRTERIFLCLHRTRILRSACVLTLWGVESAEINVNDNLEYYSLFSLKYDSQRKMLRFKTEGAIDIALKLNRIEGRLADTGETSWEQFGYLTLDFGKGPRK